MKTVLLLILFLFTTAQSPLTPELGYLKGQGKRDIPAQPTTEHLKPLSEILLYCNSSQFVDTMMDDYHLEKAVEGIVNDKRHKDLLKTQLWINPRSKQWAIIFIYKGIDKSCVLGGNSARFFNPKE